MDIRQYDEKREELVCFIDQVLQLKCDLPEHVKDGLNAIQTKVYENQFRIVLISEFESGKSTTFNALCGGEEISPRGRMLRTSGTVVSAQNTMDERKVDTADVIWRSERELLLCFTKYLVQTMKTLDGERFKDCAHGEQLSGMLKLPQDIPLIRKAVRSRIRHFGSANIPQDEEEALRIALLICEFYDDPLLDQMKNQMKRYTVRDVEKMVRIPSKWNDFDLKGNNIPLAAHDCIFLFVKEIKLYIHSGNLKRSGSVIIDCPGLSASDYDTKVTFNLLENADAIWLLYSGKGMGQKDIEYAEKILQLKNKHIFFTVNALQNTEENIKKDIIPDYVKHLKKLKPEISDKDFYVYNALLALLTLQAEKLMDGTLDQDSIKTILSHTPEKWKDKPIERVLKSTILNLLSFYYGYSIDDLDDMNFDLFAPDKSGIRILQRINGLNRISELLENSVVEKKARSILIDNGAEKIVELLNQVECDLQIKDQTALASENKMKMEFTNAEKKLEQFERFCKKELKIMKDPSIDHSLALDYWENVIVSSIDEVAEKSAQRISAVNFNDVRKNTNEQIVNEVFSEVVLPKATNWVNAIRSGENAAFNSLMDSRIKTIIRNTEKEWNLLLEKQPILSGLPVPTPVIGTDLVATDFVDSVVANMPGISKDVWVGSATGAAIGALIGSFVFPVIGTLVCTAIGSVFGAAAGDGVGTGRREDFIKSKLKEELMQNVVWNSTTDPTEKENVLSKQEKRISSLRLGIIKSFENAFSDTKDAFLERRNETLSMYAQERSMRESIAEKHNVLRMKQIKPLRDELERFKSMVTKEP